MNTIDTSKVTNCKYSLKSLTAEMPWCKTLEIKRKHYTETRRPKTQRPIADCRFSVAINCRVLSLAGELLVQVQGAMDGWLVRGSVCSSALDMQCNSALVKFISSSSFPRATPRKTRTQTTDGRTDGRMNELEACKQSRHCCAPSPDSIALSCRPMRRYGACAAGRGTTWYSREVG